MLLGSYDSGIEGSIELSDQTHRQVLAKQPNKEPCPVSPKIQIPEMKAHILSPPKYPSSSPLRALKALLGLLGIVIT